MWRAAEVKGNGNNWQYQGWLGGWRGGMRHQKKESFQKEDEGKMKVNNNKRWRILDKGITRYLAM